MLPLPFLPRTTDDDDRELLLHLCKLYSKYHINMMFVYAAVCGVVNVNKELYRDD